MKDEGGRDEPPRRQEKERMKGDGRGSHGGTENTEVQKEISHKDAQEAQDFQIINACRADRHLPVSAACVNNLKILCFLCLCG